MLSKIESETVTKQSSHHLTLPGLEEKNIFLEEKRRNDLLFVRLK
jgi:hypothetical protein